MAAGSISTLVPDGQAAEEIHHAAAAHHGQCLLPGGRIAGRFDHRIGAALVFGQISDGVNHIGELR